MAHCFPVLYHEQASYVLCPSAKQLHIGARHQWVETLTNCEFRSTVPLLNCGFWLLCLNAKIETQRIFSVYSILVAVVLLFVVLVLRVYIWLQVRVKGKVRFRVRVILTFLLVAIVQTVHCFLCVCRAYICNCTALLADILIITWLLHSMVYIWISLFINFCLWFR